MTGGKKPREKGGRGEREIVKELQKRGVSAEKVPLSGAVGGEFEGDIWIGEDIAEVKRRKDGFRELYKWLKDHDVVFLQADRQDCLCG